MAHTSIVMAPHIRISLIYFIDIEFACVKNNLQHVIFIILYTISPFQYSDFSTRIFDTHRPVIVPLR